MGYIHFSYIFFIKTFSKTLYCVYDENQCCKINQNKQNDLLKIDLYKNCLFIPKISPLK